MNIKLKVKIKLQDFKTTMVTLAEIKKYDNQQLIYKIWILLVIDKKYK